MTDEPPNDTGLFEDLTWRGLVHQVTDRDAAQKLLNGRGLKAYIGFDPTAASLHVGSLLPITMLLRLQIAGHVPLPVVGGGTGLIGDPSGKSAERLLLSAAQVQSNTDALAQQLHKIWHNLGLQPPHEPIDNNSWLSGLSLIEFLRDIGKFFSVGAMIQRDSVRTRLHERDQGISFTEFSYMLLQAFDFLELHRRHDCCAQFGGSDQWGNIVSGIDLIGRVCGHDVDKPVFGLTMPLITTRSGQKFGKTEAGTVWLDPQMTSPYKFYQFWINVEDVEVGPYLRFFTFLAQADIQAIEREHAAAPHLRAGQKALAREVTALVHGSEAMQHAERASQLLFGGDPKDSPEPVLAMLKHEIPAFNVDAAATVGTLLVGAAPGQPFKSNSEAKRAVAAGSVYLNGAKVIGELNAPIAGTQWLHDVYILIRVGKKQYHLAEMMSGTDK